MYKCLSSVRSFMKDWSLCSLSNCLDSTIVEFQLAQSTWTLVCSVLRPGSCHKITVGCPKTKWGILDFYCLHFVVNCKRIPLGKCLLVCPKLRLKKWSVPFKSRHTFHFQWFDVQVCWDRCQLPSMGSWHRSQQTWTSNHWKPKSAMISVFQRDFFH